MAVTNWQPIWRGKKNNLFERAVKMDHIIYIEIVWAAFKRRLLY